MNIADIVVIIILTVVILGAVFGMFRQKKNGSCLGDCSRCLKCKKKGKN